MPARLNERAISDRSRGKSGRRLALAYPLGSLVVTSALFLATFANNALSPLYVIYQQRYGLSALVITALSATYAAGVLVALLISGGLSDVVGRRPLLVAGSLLVLASSVIFLVAHASAPLFIGRAVLGIAVGILTAAGSAALVELDPAHDRRRAATWTTVALLGGTAVGPLAAGVMAQYLPQPTRTSYLVELLPDVLGLIAIALMPESAHHELSRFRLQFQRLSVPHEVRKPFWFVCAVVSAGWMMGGIYASLSGTIDRELLHVRSHAIAGLVLFVFASIAGTSQLLARAMPAQKTMLFGLVATAIGVILVAVSVVATSAALFVVASVASGVGNGLCFVGSLAEANELAPSRRRAEMVAVYSVVMYGTLVIPVIGMGLLADSLGLKRATVIFASVLTLFCIALLTAMTTRPALLRTKAPSDSAFLENRTSP